MPGSQHLVLKKLTQNQLTIRKEAKKTPKNPQRKFYKHVPETK